MKNMEIRQAAADARLKLYEVADLVHVSPSWLSVKLRHELPESDKKQIIEKIKAVAKVKE